MAEATDALQDREQALPNDLLISVTVKVGERLYHELKDTAPGEAADLLRGYADRSKGTVRAMFVLLAEWHGLLPLVPLREMPPESAQNATGGCTVQVGLCGSPCPNNLMPVYSNNQPFVCETCVIIG
jgi:hypothetical protein